MENTLTTTEQALPAEAFRSIIDRAAGGVPADDDIALINRLARSPVDPEQVYVFPMIPSNDSLDCYYTRMSQSSLQNYAADCAAGVGIMNSHRTSSWSGDVELPIGRTFYGEMRASPDGAAALIARAYLLRDYQPNPGTVNTDVLIRGIENGAIFDLSIGFKVVGGGWYRCSICGFDLMSQKCSHYPGYSYDGERCFAWVENARLSEVSLVYDGATPGAGIRKAEMAAQAGLLDRKMAGQLEDLYQVRLARRWAVPDLASTDRGRGVDAAQQPTNEEGGEPLAGEQTGERTANEAMQAAEFVALIVATAQQRAGKTLSAATLAAMEAVRTKVEAGRAACEEAAGMMADLMASTEGDSEGQNSARLADLERQVADLSPLAETGRQYRADLIEEALTEGVRAFGNTFQRELHRRIFERASLEEIKAIRAEWQGLSRDKFGDGKRQSQPVELPSNAPAKAKRANTQYQG